MSSHNILDRLVHDMPLDMQKIDQSLKTPSRSAYTVCSKNARGKNVVGKNVRGKNARCKNVIGKNVIGKNARAKVVKYHR